MLPTWYLTRLQALADLEILLIVGEDLDGLNPKMLDEITMPILERFDDVSAPIEQRLEMTHQPCRDQFLPCSLLATLLLARFQPPERKHALPESLFPIWNVSELPIDLRLRPIAISPRAWRRILLHFRRVRCIRRERSLGGSRIPAS